MDTPPLTSDGRTFSHSLPAVSVVAASTPTGQDTWFHACMHSVVRENLTRRVHACTHARTNATAAAFMPVLVCVVMLDRTMPGCGKLSPRFCLSPLIVHFNPLVGHISINTYFRSAHREDLLEPRTAAGENSGSRNRAKKADSSTASGRRPSVSSETSAWESGTFSGKPKSVLTLFWIRNGSFSPILLCSCCCFTYMSDSVNPVDAFL